MTDLRSPLQQIRTRLQRDPHRWSITGVAGFIGSNLLEELLALDQEVVGLDNFSTGNRRNLDEVRENVGDRRWSRFRFIEGDLRDQDACRAAVTGVDYVLHEAALGSVPRSVADPIATNEVNIGGFLNIIVASTEAKVRKFIYAGSSSTYGDDPGLPKVEDTIGRPLSPYAVTKYANELYAGVFSRLNDFCAVGVRYFNVFGPRQDPAGAYAAVIPKWIAAMMRDEPVVIYGDGETTRDFSFIANVVQANLLAAMSEGNVAGEVYNVAYGARTSLNTLFLYLRKSLAEEGIEYRREPIHRDFRSGDVRHSQADIARAARALGYAPTHDLRMGIREAMPWYVRNLDALTAEGMTVARVGLA